MSRSYLLSNEYLKVFEARNHPQKCLGHLCGINHSTLMENLSENSIQTSANKNNVCPQPSRSKLREKPLTKDIDIDAMMH